MRRFAAVLLLGGCYPAIAEKGPAGAVHTDGTDDTSTAAGEDGTDSGTGGDGDSGDGDSGDGDPGDGGTGGDGDSGDGSTGGGGDAGSGADWGALEPCRVALPSDTVVYSSDAVVTDSGSWGLVCRNATVSFSGAGARAAVVAGGDAVLTGSGGLAWVADRGSVVVLGPDAGVGADDLSDVLDNSGTADVTDCGGGLVLDLSALPSGC